MYKWLMAIVVILMIGDPGMSWLATVEEMKDNIIAGMIAILAAPWVVSQFDN